MALDISLNVAIAVVMIALSYFGIASSERRRWPIGALFLVGVGLVVWQAYRSVSAQGQLNAEIGNLKREIKGLEGKLPKPHVPTASLRVSNVEVIQMGNDQPVKANVHLQNNGDTTAEGFYRVTRFKFVKSSPASPAEDKVLEDIKTEMASSSDTGGSIAAGGKIFFTVTGPELHKEDFLPPNSSQPQVIRNGEFLILAGRIRYRSSPEKTILDRDSEFCMFVMNPNVLIMCKGHNH